MGWRKLTNEITLNEADFRSPTWKKLKDIFEQRIVKHRKQNDLDLNEAETVKLRGRISELKYLIDLEAGPSQQIDANE